MSTPANQLRLMASVGSATWCCPHCELVTVRRIDWLRVTGPNVTCPRCQRTVYVDLARLCVPEPKEADSESTQETD